MVFIQDTERRDSIPEEDNEQSRLHGQSRQMKPILEIDLTKQANIDGDPNQIEATGNGDPKQLFNDQLSNEKKL